MHRDALRTVRENDSQITGPACGARPERQCEQEQGPILSFEKPKVVTARPASRRNRNELELTAEDYEFLSQVGIKP